MKKSIAILISLLLLLMPAFLIAAQDEKQTNVEKPKTKYEVAEKLYKEYNVTPPSNYVPPADSHVEMDQEALDEFESSMRDAFEGARKTTIENEKKIKALGDVEGIPGKIVNGLLVPINSDRTSVNETTIDLKNIDPNRVALPVEGWFYDTKSLQVISGLSQGEKIKLK
jgi:hypothetical protein